MTYKREVRRFYQRELVNYPPCPEHYFNDDVKAIFKEYEQNVKTAKENQTPLPLFPETLVIESIDNTWRDTAKAVFNNWLGQIYKITHQDRRLPFQDGVDPKNPLNL